MDCNTIERVTLGTREEFENAFVRKSRPVIIEGGMKDWGALGKWTEDYLRTSRVASRTVPIEHYADGNRYRFPIWSPRPMKDMRLGDYMKLLTSAEATHYYLADEEIKTALPELWADVGAPPLFDRRLLVKTGMFLGRDTVDGMHCHPIHQVLVCQVTGERQIDLFEPDDGQLFAPAPWYSPNFNWSTLDFDRVDPGRKHEFEERRYSTILRPGEMLFIPVQWWNLMRGPGFNASVCLIWHAEFRDWSPRSSARVVAAGLVNNPLVRPFVLPWLQKRFEARASL